MNFFGREKEIEILRRERELSLKNSRFTVVSGRRRIGKTEQDISLFREASAKSQAGLQVFAAVVGGHVGVEMVSRPVFKG